MAQLKYPGWTIASETWGADEVVHRLNIVAANFVLDCFCELVGVEALTRFTVEIRQDPVGPMSCAQRDNPGRGYTTDFRIYLDCEPGSYQQLIYQLAHETCHVMMDNRPFHKHLQWISECLCEAASLQVLELARINALELNAALGYKRSSTFVHHYIDRVLPPCSAKWEEENVPVDIFSFYSRYRDCFISDPNGPLTENDLRWRNEKMALAFLDWLKNEPECWRSITDIPSGDAFITTQDFLVSWVERTMYPYFTRALLALVSS